MTFHSGANLRPVEIEGVEKRDEWRWIIAQVKTDLRDVGKPGRNRRGGVSQWRLSRVSDWRSFGAFGLVGSDKGDF